jgi:hypothetical protein
MLAFGAGRNRQVRDLPHKVLPSFGDAPGRDNHENRGLTPKTARGVITP